MVVYKQRCIRCKKNFALILSRRQFPLCTECDMKEIDDPIEDEEMCAFFDIKREFYEQTPFLRSIKKNYLRYGALTPKQREIFLKVVEELKSGKKREPKA